MSVDTTSVLVRALSFIAMFQAAGAVIVIALFGRRLERSTRSIRKLGRMSALAAMVLVAAHYAMEAGRMGGSVAGMFDVGLQQLVFDSPLSSAAIWRLSGLALIAATVLREGAMAKAIGLAGTLCVTFAFTLVGHTADESRAGWLAAVLMLHLLAVAFWFGSLLPLIIIGRREPGILAAQIVARFSRIAIVLVPGLFLFGAALTWALVDGWSVFRHSYGLLLLGKFTGFALLMVLASLNKWRYGPALAHTPAAAAAFQKAVGAEYLLICAVLVVTAAMTAFFSPEP